MTRPTSTSRPRGTPAPTTSAFAGVVTGAAAIRARNMRLKTPRAALDDRTSAIRLPAPPPAETPLAGTTRPERNRR